MAAVTARRFQIFCCGADEKITPEIPRRCPPESRVRNSRYKPRIEVRNDRTKTGR